MYSQLSSQIQKGEFLLNLKECPESIYFPIAVTVFGNFGFPLRDWEAIFSDLTAGISLSLPLFIFNFC